MVIALLGFSDQAMAFHFSVDFGLGGETKTTVCQPNIDKGVCVTETKSGVKPEAKPKSNPRPKPAVALAKSTDAAKSVEASRIEPKPKAAPKPEYLKKAEKAVKVKRPYKRDWNTLTANSIGAAGITYGARKSNWFIGSGGALVLMYSLIAERNTNSPLDQIVSVTSGVGLGYLPKISSDKEDNKASNPTPTPLPPPPAP